MMKDRSKTPVARQVATFILLIFMIASAFSAFVTVAGNTTLGLYICGGAIVVGLVVLLIGGLVVAANRPREDE
jgi:uncharacterized membrane protein YdbT with pleckstrin-like domain